MADHPEQPELYLHSTLYTKVVLALITGRSAAECWTSNAPSTCGRCARLPAARTRGDLADQLICDHALFHLEADLRWLELTAARLDELAEEVK